MVRIQPNSDIFDWMQHNEQKTTGEGQTDRRVTTIP